LSEAALYGPAGDFVRLVEPHTEADRAAILTQFLVGVGNCIGGTPHYLVEADRHRLNEFLVLVGSTSSGRKGTALGQARRLLALIDEDWNAHRVKVGLASGEGLINQVRDAVPADAAHPRRLADEGVTDKRLLVMEPEFVSVLRQISRDGNVLSPTMRQAWDGADLETLTKNSHQRATGAHVSIIGHITAEELRRELDAVDFANGFLNRFLLVCVKRARCLPDGGRLDVRDLEPLAQRLRLAVSEIRRHGRMTRDAEATTLWHGLYPALTTGRPGLVGAIRARAAAHVLRLSCIYAALDGTPTITRVHLQAALAVWNYADDSATHLFGDRVGDVLADHALKELRAAGPRGLTRSEIRDIYGRNHAKEDIDRALGLLLEYGLASTERDTSNPGRPVERWYATARQRGGVA